MALNPMYGTGVYNSNLPQLKLSTPQIAGGVASPLAFFPSSSVQSGITDEALANSLEGIIADYASGSGSDGGGSVSTGGSGVSGGQGGTSTQGGGWSGVGNTTASIGGTVVGGMFGALTNAPAPVTSLVSSLTKGALKGEMDEEDVLESIGKAVAVTVNPALPAVYEIGKLIAQKLGLMDIGSIFGPTDEGLGYTSQVVGEEGRVTFSQEQEAPPAPESFTPSFNPDDYSGPKAGEVSSPESESEDGPMGPADPGQAQGSMTESANTSNDTTSSDSNDSSDSSGDE